MIVVLGLHSFSIYLPRLFFSFLFCSSGPSYEYPSSSARLPFGALEMPLGDLIGGASSARGDGKQQPPPRDVTALTKAPPLTISPFGSSAHSAAVVGSRPVPPLHHPSAAFFCLFLFPSPTPCTISVLVVALRSARAYATHAATCSHRSRT